MIVLLQLTIARLKASRDRVNTFIDRNIVDWAETEMLSPAREDLLQAGLSQDAASGLNIRKTGFMKISMTWEYVKNGLPIQNYIEYDTKSHWIYAKGKITGGSDFLSWVGKNGRRVYAKKVFHPGTTGKHLVRNAVTEYKPFLTQRIITETNNYIQVNKL